jgi:predicted nuclease of predicted toxin-antitoxin system
MRFLVDEMLSRAVVTRLHERGHFAERISDVGLSGRLDHVVWSEAFKRDAVVITANAEHFLELAEQSELHVGLIVLRTGDLTREEQLQWIDAVLTWIARSSPDLVNHVVEVWGPTEADIHSYPLPP